MQKKICYLLFAFVSVVSSQAQVAVSGTISDSLGKPLQSVSVTLKKNNGIVLAFAITNNTGSFKIQHASASVKDTLFVEANAIGFSKKSIPVTKTPQVTDFKLSATSTKLPNVTVKSNPLRKEGDTLNYDVATFGNKQDRVIGDVIKKLPGVEVSENGQISVGGKPINRFYIDGDNLLDGKYNIATQSVPSDMVSKIQVLENHQPVNALKDLVKSDAAAMNIVLKDKARMKIMGTGDALVGTPDAYSVTANAMLFKKQVKFINYYKLNNIGYDLSDEVINHFGFDNQPPANLVNAGTAGNPDLLKKRYLFNNVGLVNINDMINLKKDMQLRINGFYLFDKQYQSSEFKSTYFLPNDTIRYAEKQDSRTLKNTFNTQLTLTANRKDYYLNDVAVLENTPSQIFSALQATTNNNINQQLTGTVTNISNKFNIITKTKKGNVLEGYSFINNIRNPATLMVNPGLYAAQFNNNNPYAGLIQQAAVPTFYTDNYVSFGIAHSKFQQQYKAGINYQEQQVNSLLESEQLSGSKAAVADSFMNRLNWSRTKAYFKADFTYSSGGNMIRLSLPFTYQDTRYTGRLAENHFTNLPVTPSLSIKYMTGKEDYLSVAYSYGDTWGNIDQVYDGYLMRGYRDFFTNGNLLTETQRHSVSASYQFRNTLKIFFFSLGGSYSNNSANTINDTRISAVIQQAKLIPFNNLSRSTQLFAGISKYIFPLMTTVGAKASWSRSLSNQLQNGDPLQIQNDVYTYNANVNTKLATWFNLGYVGTYSSYGSKRIGDVHTTGAATPSVEKWQHEVVANFVVSNNFQIRVSGDNYRYHLSDVQNNHFTFVDASCTYKLNKLKTDIELALTNLANMDTYSSVSLSANSISESSYRIRPRMATLKFYFRF